MNDVINEIKKMHFIDIQYVFKELYNTLTKESAYEIAEIFSPLVRDEIYQEGYDDGKESVLDNAWDEDILDEKYQEGYDDGFHDGHNRGFKEALEKD